MNTVTTIEPSIDFVNQIYAGSKYLRVLRQSRGAIPWCACDRDTHHSKTDDFPVH
jgi:hypothetical protein